MTTVTNTPQPARCGATRLRPYQSDGIAAITASLARGQRPLYVLPTGGGKTVAFVHLARNYPGRVCILMHRGELIEQTSRALGDTPHGIIQAGRAPRPHARIQIASVQTLVNRLAAYSFDLIIVDEAHHTTAKSYRSIIAAYSHAALLGVTATPCRTDGTGLSDAGFDSLILGPSVAELTAQGYLTPAQVYAPHGGVDTSKLHSKYGDYVKKELSELMSKPSITGDAIAHYRRFADGQPAIAFCVSVERAEATAEMFRAQGYSAASIDGKKTPIERRQLIRALAAGTLNVLTSCDLISEGVDVPVVSCGIMLRPTQSLALWLQQIGRCLRPAPGKTHAVILDHVGNSLRHGMPESVREWSLYGAPVCRVQRDADDAPARCCLQCYRTHEPRPVCPFCGFVYPARPREIAEVSGELALLDAQWDAVKAVPVGRMEEWQCKSLADYQALAEERGYKPGWAFVRWNAKQKQRASA